MEKHTINTIYPRPQWQQYNKTAHRRVVTTNNPKLFIHDFAMRYKTTDSTRVGHVLGAAIELNYKIANVVYNAQKSFTSKKSSKCRIK